MDKLRTIALLITGSTTLIAALGIIAVIADFPQLVVSLLFIGMVINVLSILVVARYLARNARTGEERTKAHIRKLTARLKLSAARNDEVWSEMRELIEGTEKSVQEMTSSTMEGLARVDERIIALDKSFAQMAKTGNRHTSVTVYDGVRQIESLIQLYQRYPQVQMPMPSTGRWAIDSQALAQLLALVEERKPNRILELGSGTSTIWLGYLCRSYGGKLVTLDHLQQYLELTRTAVRRHELQDVIDSRLAPLEPTTCGGRTFKWYSAEALKGLEDIDMVVIDGPPGSTGPQARYPALPKVVQLLAPEAIVVLDDAHRDEENKIVNSWLEAFPDFERIEQGTSRLAVLQRQPN